MLVKFSKSFIYRASSFPSNLALLCEVWFWLVEKAFACNTGSVLLLRGLRANNSSNLYVYPFEKVFNYLK